MAAWHAEHGNTADAEMERHTAAVQQQLLADLDAAFQALEAAVSAALGWIADGSGGVAWCGWAPVRLAGWRSRAMLQRYGASAADARARDGHRRPSPASRL